MAVLCAAIVISYKRDEIPAFLLLFWLAMLIFLAWMSGSHSGSHYHPCVVEDWYTMKAKCK